MLHPIGNRLFNSFSIASISSFSSERVIPSTDPLASAVMVEYLKRRMDSSTW